jgi:3-oxoacyl-ACP reductase-like protein
METTENVIMTSEEIAIKYLNLNLKTIDDSVNASIIVESKKIEMAMITALTADILNLYVRGIQNVFDSDKLRLFQEVSKNKKLELIEKLLKL